MKKTMPLLSVGQIISMSFGFMGIQIGYSLQNGNTSRILSALGADVDKLSFFWLAAPLAGIIVQPIVGLSSDKTWTRLGRRIPFILGGAIVSSFAMFLMPNSEFFVQLMPALIFGTVMLLMMDASFNVTMQPFRSLVGDMVSDEQRNIGYSIQSVLINIGAVLGSLLPFILTSIGVANEPAVGEKVAPTVIWSFYIGGAILLGCVLVTVFTTKEYPPKEYDEYHNISKEEKSHSSLLSLVKDMPKQMWQLAIVQFFSWMSLFMMWVYSTPAIAQNVWNTSPGDSTSPAYNEAANWVGIMFAAYSLFAALFSLKLGSIANRFGRKKTFIGTLIIGGLGFISSVFIKNKYGLILSEVGIGIFWASILTLPYAILSAALPASKMGVYMGLFNITVTLPQIFVALLGGILLRMVGGHPIYMIGLAGVSAILAGISVMFVTDAKNN